MGGRASRDKGNRFERAIVKALTQAGIKCERVPLSGAAGGSYTGDIIVSIGGRELRIEAKHRANGFKELYAWLEGRDALIVRADRKEPLAVIPMALVREFLK